MENNSTKGRSVNTFLRYSKDSLTDFFKFQTLKISKIKYVYFILSLLCLVLGLCEIFAWKKVGVGIVICVLSAILMGTFPLQINAMIKHQVNDMCTRADIKLTIDEEGIHQSLRDKKFAFDEWDKFHFVYETDKYLYFYTDKFNAIIVVKSLISTDDVNYLLELSSKHNLKYKKY